MPRAILALTAAIMLTGCFADSRIEQKSEFGHLFGLAQQSRQSGDYSQAWELFAAARDAATTPQQRYLAAFGQFDLATASGGGPRAVEAANAVLASGAAIDPVLQARLREWTAAGAVIEGPVAIDPELVPSPNLTPAIPVPVADDQTSIPVGGKDDESIQLNSDGSVSWRALERQRRDLPPGVAEFHVPTDMVANEEAEVWYKVQVSEVGAFRIVPAPGAPVNPATNRVYHVKVGRCMSAELSGAGFAIEAPKDQDKVQNTGADRSAVWRWMVKPDSEGPSERKLTLTSRVLAYVAGRCADQLDLLPEQNRSVKVKVAPPGPTPAPSPTPSPVPPTPPMQNGRMGWLGLLGLALTAFAAFLAKVNGLLDESIKFRDRLLMLLGRKPKEATPPPAKPA